MGFKDKLIGFLEGKPDPLEKQLADAEAGRFRCYLHGSLEEFEGAYCYLYAGETSADLDKIFRGSKTILMTDAGVETGVVRWGRWVRALLHKCSVIRHLGLSSGRTSRSALSKPDRTVSLFS
jgi:hypothetical protein